MGAIKDLREGESELFDDLIGKSFEEVGKCLGLVREVYKRRGIEIPDFNTHSIEEEHETIENEKNNYTEKIDSPEPYCIVTFKTVGPFVTHMGVVLEDCKTFIHAERKKNVAIEKLSHLLWKQKIKEFRKWKTCM